MLSFSGEFGKCFVFVESNEYENHLGVSVISFDFLILCVVFLLRHSSGFG